jgi:hypothetical protein
MNVILDIIGSFVIRGMIVLIVLTAMVSLNNSLFRQTERVALNDLVTNTSETIYNDFSLAGYGASTSKVFNKADSIEAIFSADLDNDGTAETVRYYLGAGAAGSHRILYRTLNAGTPFEIARDVILIRFYYYSATNVSLTGTTVSGIKSINVSLTIESNHQLISLYSGSADTSSYQQATWEGHIFPKGL